MPTVGLALGGGGARGLVHLGVIKVLEEENIPIDIICGTSMGAIIGAIYAQQGNIEEAIKKVKAYLDSEKHGNLELPIIGNDEQEDSTPLSKLARTLAKRVYAISLGARRPFFKSHVLDEAVNFLVKEGKIEETKIPFAAVATDLNSGKTLIFDKGDIRKAVKRSSLVPGFLPPEKEKDLFIADGGITQLIPVESTIKLGAEMVIAISASPSSLPQLKDPAMIDIIERCQLIMGLELSRLQAEKADILIKPHLPYVPWSDFSEYNKFIKIGMDSAKEHLPQIKKLLRRRESWIFRALSFIKPDKSPR
ncbi:patatin-like phospholipase family protein [Thermovirga sp.]|uniref:patatin-like phospholipase family protein n=1 Tax=Thermovirga sp. TaxID=2699834 RepID=UPI0025F128D6|nr:patatin-like phospholipase family protein [Thermovirga sp.]MBO8154065.1 patatin-like phospholipase family protein [Thermovirga sp.]